MHILNLLPHIHTPSHTEHSLKKAHVEHRFGQADTLKDVHAHTYIQMERPPLPIPTHLIPSPPPIPPHTDHAPLPFLHTHTHTHTHRGTLNLPHTHIHRSVTLSHTDFPSIHTHTHSNPPLLHIRIPPSTHTHT